MLLLICSPNDPSSLDAGAVCMRASDSRLSPGFVRLHYQLENYQNLVHYFGVVLSMETGYSI